MTRPTDETGSRTGGEEACRGGCKEEGQGEGKERKQMKKAMAEATSTKEIEVAMAASWWLGHRIGQTQSHWSWTTNLGRSWRPLTATRGSWPSWVDRWKESPGRRKGQQMRRTQRVRARQFLKGAKSRRVGWGERGVGG